MSMQILAKLPSPKDPRIILDLKKKKEVKKNAAWIREFLKRLTLG